MAMHPKLRTLIEGRDLGRGARAFLEHAGEHVNEENVDALLNAFDQGSVLDHDEAVALDETALAPPTPRSQPGRAVAVSRAVGGTSLERERARVFARHVARLAAADLGVRMFRRTLTGNPAGTLSPSKARKLLTSVALRYLSWDELRESGVPLDGTHTSTVRLEAPGDGRDVLEFMRVSVKWRKTSVAWIAPRTAGAKPRQLPGHKLAVSVEPRSFLASVDGNASITGSEYGWSNAEAIWFLLTGEVPTLESLTVGRSTFFGLSPGSSARVAAHDPEPECVATQAWITVKALPHVSPDAVAAAYAAEQRRMTGCPVRRPIENGNLSLLDFVGEQIARSGVPPDWPRLLRQWNRRKPMRRYRYASKMRDDYAATAARVFLLGMHPHGGRYSLEGVERALAHRPDAPSFFFTDGPGSDLASMQQRAGRAKGPVRRRPHSTAARRLGRSVPES